MCIPILFLTVTHRHRDSYQEQDEGGGERDAAKLAVARQVGLGELGHGVYPPRRHLEQ